MRPYTHIIASCHREAQAIARKQGLRPGQWKYVDSHRVLEGVRGVNLLRTSCAWYIGPIERIHRIEERLSCLRALGEIRSESYVDCA